VTGAEAVVGADQPADPTVSAQGGLDGYRPVAQLAPFTALVIQLTR
jgi:hypothetical protein